MDEKEQKQQEFNITFKNGALERLKKVAADLKIPEDRLGDVLIKGLNLIDIAKEGTVVTIEKGREKYVIDLRNF
ncbi:MAG: hypothetical protein AAB916_00270 [Patescibacteria group bacterium]